MMRAFLGKEEVIQIFGKDLFDAGELVELFSELMGISGIKPFECVGTNEEMLLGLWLSYLKNPQENSKIMESAIQELALISGQRPVVTKAKKSIANFKVRQGMPVGAKVTLRGDNMYEFADKFFNISLPRVRDFKGVSKNSFDGRGNYSMGIKEQLIFPEINYDDVETVKGMNIVFTTTAKTDEEAAALLELLGMPFEK